MKNMNVQTELKHEQVIRYGLQYRKVQSGAPLGYIEIHKIRENRSKAKHGALNCTFTFP